MSPAPVHDWSLTRRQSTSLEVYLLGLVDYDSALFLQQRLLYDISGRRDTLGALIVCEHPPVLTIGRDGSPVRIAERQDLLRSHQIPTRWIDRGGGGILHLPGQLAAYAILPLDRLGFGLADFRERLAQSVQDVCGDLRLNTKRADDGFGITAREGRLADIGVGVRRWTSWHGVFLNVCPDLPLIQEFEGSNSTATRITTLAACRHRTAAMHSVRSRFVSALAANLNYADYHLYTGHPLLTRTSRRDRVPQDATR